MSRPLVALAAVALAVAQLSCAASGLTPLPQSMPAARAGLRPEYRIFYDTLGDYGDWTLIEPYGFVFRPRGTYATWQPYSDGFWVPTDIYGWVWVSSEPFGWATYHYGQWFHDSFQGWVWMPGVDWAPAWVDWRVTDNYVGWAPLGPNGRASASTYRFVDSSQLGTATNLKDRVSTPQELEELGSPVSQARAVENPGIDDGVRFNRGPSIEWVERRTGPLMRAQIDDLVPAGPALEPMATPSEAAGPSRAGPAPDSVAAVRRAADRATTDARALIKSESRVQQVRAVRPFGVPSVAPAPRAKPPTPAKKSTPKSKPAPKGSVPDTTR